MHKCDWFVFLPLCVLALRYVDDPRNTDNSWMETVAVWFHANASLGTTTSLSTHFPSLFHFLIIPFAFRKFSPPHDRLPPSHSREASTDRCVRRVLGEVVGTQ